MGFKFQPLNKLVFPIVDESDAPIKTYDIDIGSEQFLRAIIERGKAVIDGARTVQDGDADSLIQSIKVFISHTLGDKEYDFLFARFDKNIFAMIELVNAVTHECMGALTDRMKLQAEKYK
jgi:hypothetical protein